MERAGCRSIAVYPGTFDPVTYGHIDIAQRAASIFEKVYVAVSAAGDEEAYFSGDERLEFASEALSHIDNVTVEQFDTLLVNYAKERGARVIVRGLRAVSDFEFEFKMAWMNRRLSPDIETIFLIPCEEYAYLSSSLVREIAPLGGDLEGLVPPKVAAWFRQEKDR